MSQSPEESGANQESCPTRSAAATGGATTTDDRATGETARTATERLPEVGQARETDLETIGAPEMRYQSAYVWLIFFSSLDIMLTWAILRRGGEEVNPIAKHIIEVWGLHGAIIFKFALMLFVIVSCEVIGRKRDLVGRRLAAIAVVISAFPVAYSLFLLVDHILVRPMPN